jgi:predicted phosphodiesterase
MKYLVFSDLHNDEAGLAAVERFASQSEYTKICLGDVINAHQKIAPDYFQRVTTFADIVLLGNHEAVLTGRCDVDVFNSKLHSMIEESRQKMTGYPEIVKVMQALPQEHLTTKAAFTHASFNASRPWRHVRYIEDLNDELQYLPRHINFIGHGHIPFIAWQKDGLWFYERQLYGKTFKLEPETKYIVNSGSLLGSREMRWHEKTHLVFDDDEQTVHFYNTGVS